MTERGAYFQLLSTENQLGVVIYVVSRKSSDLGTNQDCHPFFPYTFSTPSYLYMPLPHTHAHTHTHTHTLSLSLSLSQVPGQTCLLPPPATQTISKSHLSGLGLRQSQNRGSHHGSRLGAKTHPLYNRD